MFHFPERRGVKRAVGGHKDKTVADQVLTTASGLWNESAALGSETTIEINKTTLGGSCTDTKSTREEDELQLLRRDGWWRFGSKGATWSGCTWLRKDGVQQNESLSVSMHHKTIRRWQK